MGGPAMIEGGGLGVFTPEEIGPMAVQTANGVVDILADDEADATRIAKRVLGYFQGPGLGLDRGRPARRCGRAVPENRLRVYDVRRVIETLVDAGSFQELRPDFRARRDHRPDPDGRPADGPARQRSRAISAARWIATARTRARACCSCATPSTCRCCR